MGTRAKAPLTASRTLRSRPAVVRRRRWSDPVALVWTIFAVVGVATVVTYWRLPLGATYHFHDSGISGALSRAVTYLNFPVAIAAIGVVWAVCSTRVALVVTALCGVAFLPGVVSTSDLTASWVNLPAAVGVAIAVPASLRAHDRGARPLTRGRRVILALLLVWSVPWLIAAVGLYADDLPGLGGLLMSRDSTPGDPSLAAVHLGLHDGLFGAQLAATALILSARPLARALSLYLSLVFVYGIALAVQDGWSEQVLKRGWSGTDLPSVMQPSVGLPWLGLLLAAALVHCAWFGRAGRARGRP